MALEKTYEFLNELEANNNREWFAENKPKYQEAKIEFENFIQGIILRLHEVDSQIGNLQAKDCIFRIFRDVRFSKDKVPYKTNFGAYMSTGGWKSPKAGYYLHVEPNSSFLGGGIYMPESANLNKIRTEIFENPVAYKKIINDKQFVKVFPEIYGGKLKTAPRGFPKDFEDIDLLRNKHYAVTHRVDDSFWKNDKVVEMALDVYKTQKDFNDFLNMAIS